MCWVVSESATIRPESCGQLATGPHRMAVWPYRRDARSSEVEAFSGRLSPLPKSRAKPRDQRSTGSQINTALPRLQRGGVGHGAPNDQAHRRQWSATELPSGGAPC